MQFEHRRSYRNSRSLRLDRNYCARSRRRSHTRTSLLCSRIPGSYSCCPDVADTPGHLQPWVKRNHLIVSLFKLSTKRWSHNTYITPQEATAAAAALYVTHSRRTAYRPCRLSPAATGLTYDEQPYAALVCRLMVPAAVIHGLLLIDRLRRD